MHEPRASALLRQLLGPALLTVLVTDLVGGLLDVSAGRSSLASYRPRGIRTRDPEPEP